MAMIIITGAAGAGKSSLTKLLRERLPKDKFAMHDIDESDKWTHDYPAWRDAKIDYWLQRAISNDEAGMSTGLCGIIYPENVEKAPSYSKDLMVKYFLLDVSAHALEDRLLSKFGTEAERSELDPEKRGSMERKLKRQLEIVDELREAYQNVEGGYIIDTSSISVEDVSDRVVRILMDDVG